MEQAIKQINSLANRFPDLKEVSAGLNSHLATFKGQLEYVQMFLAGVRKTDAVQMSAAGQIRHVLRRFESFATEHGVEITTEAAPQAQTPPLPPAMYSGVLLNLYSNALKAVLSVASSIRNPKIAIRSWNERGLHCLEVSDNGIGVPVELRKRIWEPLYTTTSDTGNPLGSGMGLGLTLVKQVVEDAGGKIVLADDPPPGFNTCFRVVFPLE
jgi:signal transduction histidine kinase